MVVSVVIAAADEGRVCGCREDCVRGVEDTCGAGGIKLGYAKEDPSLVFVDEIDIRELGGVDVGFAAGHGGAPDRRHDGHCEGAVKEGMAEGFRRLLVEKGVAEVADPLSGSAFGAPVA